MDRHAFLHQHLADLQQRVALRFRGAFLQQAFRHVHHQHHLRTAIAEAVVPGVGGHAEGQIIGPVAAGEKGLFRSGRIGAELRLRLPALRRVVSIGVKGIRRIVLRLHPTHPGRLSVDQDVADEIELQRAIKRRSGECSDSHSLQVIAVYVFFNFKIPPIPPANKLIFTYQGARVAFVRVELERAGCTPNGRQIDVRAIPPDARRAEVIGRR